ncbi:MULTISPECIES: MarR family winged helix-turn-helix transcriptional regulator [unclassified Sporolactobacillus]|uniref:MarR family winged helix-turn-helix transcriptional regulator n=1 Tax=unclassified Sporolactobacillus TaxID=2628533 RepID=UPI0023678E1B|nr:MarR family transcriptional regulator [Sporolactobacillus sp. CQH2019]MDD9148762.1 MarR family transcriptional regulator [Sporolactobacillus sp. CQH2019]
MQEEEEHFSVKEKRLGVRLWSNLSRSYISRFRRSNEFLREWHLSSAQFDVLTLIGSHARLSQKELAEKLMVTKGNITQILRKMEDAGYIIREQEWKTKYLSLTEKGTVLFNEILPMQEAFQASLFQTLTKKERKQLLKLLKKVNRE